ncbi:MAG: hypothetical protein GY821_01935 [Gammaproteobacteria bacterium]|nr:hypothetical protein [Gammaproteobacteria bacterium]
MLDIANLAAIIAALIILTSKIYEILHHHLHVIFDLKATSLHTVFNAGSKLTDFIVLLQAFSMLYDLFDNVKLLMKISHAFHNTKYDLKTSTVKLLWAANIITGLAIGIDIAFSTVGLVAKNSHYLLHFVPGLTVAIQAMNIFIDITQTLLFISQLKGLLKEIRINENANTKTGSKKQKDSDSLNKVDNLLILISEQYYALTLRTTAKILLLATCIIAIALNPIVGIIVTLGAVLIAQGLKKEAKNTDSDLVKHQTSVFYRFGVGQTMYESAKGRYQKRLHNNGDEFDTDDEGTAAN